MQPTIRKRDTLHPATFSCSRSASSSSPTGAVRSGPGFQLDLWLGFTVQGWILDVGRSVTLLLPADWFPPKHPGIAECLHFLYSVTTPLILLKMLERSPRMLPRLVVHLGIIAVVMGTSLHLVADSVTLRLLLKGYQLHLPVREDPVMKDLQPSSLVDLFELLFYCDETFGHIMLYVPLYLVLVLYFSGCFCQKRRDWRTPAAAWILLPPNAAYLWCLITEGQTVLLFTFSFFVMAATVMHQRRRDLVLDVNGLFMLYSFSAALCLLAVWEVCLWNHSVLRRKLPGVIYVPQPRVVYTLHLRHA